MKEVSLDRVTACGNGY